MAYARSRGIQNLHVETDSQELVKLWGMGELQRSRVSPIIREIRELCTVFHAFSLVYANRSCNHVAHTLAKQVSKGNRVGEWHTNLMTQTDRWRPHHVRVKVDETT